MVTIIITLSCHVTSRHIMLVVFQDICKQKIFHYERMDHWKWQNDKLFLLQTVAGLAKNHTEKEYELNLEKINSFTDSFWWKHFKLASFSIIPAYKKRSGRSDWIRRTSEICVEFHHSCITVMQLFFASCVYLSEGLWKDKWYVPQ